MKPLNVKLSAIEKGLFCSGHYICHLCGKQIHSSKVFPELWDKLTDKEFYCSFCLRHGYHTGQKDILPLTFRGVIAHYYYFLYCQTGEISLSKIEDYIQAHQKAGLQNPLFAYDPQTYLWFVDFSQVTDEVIRKAIAETMSLIFKEFQWAKYVPDLDYSEFAGKFDRAMDNFVKTRSRVGKSKIVCPTFWNCLPVDYFGTYDFDYVEAKLFLPGDLCLAD